MTSAERVLEFTHHLQLPVVVGSADRSQNASETGATGFSIEGTGSELDQNFRGQTPQRPTAEAAQPELLRKADPAERKTHLALAGNG